MNFVGSSWSVLRLHSATGVLIHVPVTQDLDGSTAFSVDVPRRLTTAIKLAERSDVLIETATHSRTVRLTRGHEDLWADFRSPMATFRSWAHGRFEFLVIDDPALAHLQAILRQRWARGMAADGPEISIVPDDNFVLDLGIGRLDLRRSLPRPLCGGVQFILEVDTGEITITPTGPVRDEIQLKKRAWVYAATSVPDAAELRGHSNSKLEVVGEEEFGSLPITVCDADRDWLYRYPYCRRDQTIGRHRCRTTMVHETDKYLLLERFAEGVIFDDSGVCNEDGYLDAFGYRGAKPSRSLPRGMRENHHRLFVDRKTLARSPLLEGHTIVFVLGTLTNYTHWLVDCLLSLYIMLDLTPEGCRIVIPGTLRGFRQSTRPVIDHFDTLRVLGFDCVPSAEIAGPYCRLEHAYWLEGPHVSNVPGEYLRRFRSHIMNRRPTLSQRGNRIYIARRSDRRIINTEFLLPFLERHGFTTHYMDDYSFEQQISMFSQAEWVIGPHGAELGNLLFCQPGTKVLELAPDVDYKPYFSYMCNKLSLTHGVLPCPTTDGTFFGDMKLNMPKFAALFRMLKSRL